METLPSPTSTLDHEPVKDLLNRIIASTGQTLATLLPPSQKRFVSTEENTVTEATIQTILEAELPAGKKEMHFLCEATITDVSRYDGWYYNACPNCPRKIRIDNGKLYCDSCTQETAAYKPRYKVIVVVKDNSTKTTFTLFNKEVERLIGVPVQNVINEIGQAKLTTEIPPIVRNVIGKKCAFEVKLTSFNQDGREGYGVARLSEITAQTPIATEVGNADEASTSKKQKLT